MILLSAFDCERSLAENRLPQTEPLVESESCCTVVAVADDPTQRLSVTHPNHTPSPKGRCDVPNIVPPRFLRGGGRCGVGKTAASGAEPVTPFRVGFAEQSRQGTTTCPYHEISPSRSAFVPRFRLAATPSENKPLAARPLARAPRPSQAVAWPRVRPSVQLATSPIASLTPANVTDACAPGAPGTSFEHSPAQRLLSRGFSVHTKTKAHTKTKKDSPCSTRS